MIYKQVPDCQPSQTAGEGARWASEPLSARALPGLELCLLAVITVEGSEELAFESVLRRRVQYGCRVM